jgi:hypothetical protein
MAPVVFKKYSSEVEHRQIFDLALEMKNKTK